MGALDFQGILAVLFLAVSIRGLDYSYKNMECPFPEGQSVSSETECQKYTSCEWDHSFSLCHMKKNSEAGYMVAGERKKTARGSKTTLKKMDPSLTMFHGDIQQLVFEVIDHEEYHVQLKIYDAETPRYEVPVPLNLPDTPATQQRYIVSQSAEGEPFTFSVGRKGSAKENTLFNLVGPLTFEDQFIQFTTTLPTTYMYGMGENAHPTFKHIFAPRQTYPIFPRDHEVIEEVVNLYGHQPYYVNVDPTTEEVHSVLFHNSNAMEYSTFMLDYGSPALTLRTIGGIIDLHIFLGPTLEDVNRQYVNMIGLPIMPPYWTLGFHLSRDGYQNPEEVRKIRKKMKAYQIRQDVQFFDVNYMYDRRDFTYDQTDWKDLPEFIEELHNDTLKVTIILDPPIASDFDEYPPGQRGKEADVFIKWLSEAYIPDDQDPSWGSYMVGRVWPSFPTVFPDFLNPVAQEWWSNELDMFRKVLNYDGIWIDMNEVTNFGTNPFGVEGSNYPNKTDLQCPDNKYDSPPYPTIMTRTGGSVSKRISETTICMSGNQTDGMNRYLHYDVHSLYGWSHTVATYKAMRSMNPGKRPMILTRSTFPGSGQYGFHWLGDNSSKWEHLKMSIIGILEFNLFGIPMVGADICGFNGNATMELCARWMQLGSFYPYSRNHNCGEVDQDPTAWREVAETSAHYLHVRYNLLPYLYSLFRRAHLYGESVVRPIFSQFLSDTKALKVDDQFFWGDGLMVAPVITEGATSRTVYFPKGEWYDTYGQKVVTGPATLELEAPLDKLPYFILGGNIIPIQLSGLTTDESRDQDFGLNVFLNSSLAASGEIFWDDGETDLDLQEPYLALTSFSDNILNVNVLNGSSSVAGLSIFVIQVCEYSSSPKAIEIDGEILPPEEWSYNEELHILRCFPNVPLGNSITLKIIV
ncbi:sucrase-isomaltase, intestinal-like isoform X2 [Macrobrachium nipponense]|uniref:sucrase-isomaltase, intestinal-like isoform X2 n=1 Tax=Macrobrachium nipponense TaxID=159736 RepID=UPI0030C8860C